MTFTPKIKICGLVRKEDAQVLNDVSPEYVGFVFFPKSKRFVSDEEAAELRICLSEEISTVGVFVDDAIEHIVSLYRAGTVQIAQLHGSETDGYIKELRNAAPEIEIWKAFTISSPSDIDDANASASDLVLLDNGMGSGKTFDWSLIEMMNRPFILAGGLSCETINEAIRTCDMHESYLVGVDVSSGVEEKQLGADGRTSKDAIKVTDFIKIVKANSIMERASYV